MSTSDKITRAILQATANGRFSASTAAQIAETLVSSLVAKYGLRKTFSGVLATAVQVHKECDGKWHKGLVAELHHAGNKMPYGEKTPPCVPQMSEERLWELLVRAVKELLTQHVWNRRIGTPPTARKHRR